MAQKISNSESNDDFYACKVIKRPQNQNNDLFSNIARECEILSKLEHPNMIKLHAALKTQNNLYLITDYCDQGDLTTFVSKLYAQQNQNSKGEQCGTKLIENQGRDLLNSKSRVSENEARYILNQILQGLSYLHDQCVVHRDIKMDNILVKRKKYHQFIVPQNVNKNIECNNMYDKVNQGLFPDKLQVEDFEFKVGDLGLAKSIHNPEDIINTICGTPIYMAPELFNGNSYNYKVDVWAVGTLLFHLLTGTYPFKGRNIDELKKNLRDGSYKIPKDISISIECLEFLNNCLKFKSSSRKSYSDLLNHPFLKKEKLDIIRQSKILQKGFGNNVNHQNFNRQTIELNTRNSINFIKVYNQYLAKRIDQRISRAFAGVQPLKQIQPRSPVQTPPSNKQNNAQGNGLSPRITALQCNLQPRKLFQETQNIHQPSFDPQNKLNLNQKRDCTNMINDQNQNSKPFSRQFSPVKQRYQDLQQNQNQQNQVNFNRSPFSKAQDFNQIQNDSDRIAEMNRHRKTLKKQSKNVDGEQFKFVLSFIGIVLILIILFYNKNYQEQQSYIQSSDF
eukprot:403355712